MHACPWTEERKTFLGMRETQLTAVIDPDLSYDYVAGSEKRRAKIVNGTDKTKTTILQRKVVVRV